MATADSTQNPSTRCSIAVAMPLRAHLAESEKLDGQIQPSSTLDADTIIRDLIASAGLLPDVASDGGRFVLVAASPRLLQALAAYVPPAPRPMPLLEWRV